LNYLSRINELNKENFVYIDETGIGKDCIQRHSWMKKGDKKNVLIQG
jgi:hypothetical protein